MTGEPVIELRGIEKALGESFPLRINNFTLRARERVVLSGFPGVMGEALMNLIIGASLPDEGDVIVFGKNTREISTDTECQSLDRFGLVSNRAVLLDQSTIAQNLALPLTLAIDPMSAETRATVESLAREVELPLDRLDQSPSALAESFGPVERTRLHLARALAHQPQVLLLEHPTIAHRQVGDKLGARLRTIADARKLSFIAVSDDDRFARETGGRRYRLEHDGTLRPAGFGIRGLFWWPT